MIVDAIVQVWHGGAWCPLELSRVTGVHGLPVQKSNVKTALPTPTNTPFVPMPANMSTAQAIEEARAAWRWECQGGSIRPIRVVDTSGNVVEVWPKGCPHV